MKNLLQLKNLKNLARLVAILATFLCCSGGMFATTYYVYFADNNNNPLNMSYIGTTDNTTFTVSRSMLARHNYYVMFATTKSDKPENTYAWSDKHMKCTSAVKGAGMSIVEVQGYSTTPSGQSTAIQWGICRFQLNDAGNAVTVTISDISGSNPSTAKYTVATGSSCDGKLVTAQITNGTTSSTNPQCVTSGNNATFTITPSSGYKMPTASGVSFNGAHTSIDIDGSNVTVNGVTGGGDLSVVCVEDAVWSLSGEFNNWSTSANIFEFDGTTYTTTIDLPAETTYTKSDQGSKTGFKICKNGNTWYGCDATITQSITNYNFQTDYSKNCGLTTGMDGTYTFSFTVSSASQIVVAITYPTKAPTVPTVRWGDPATVDAAPQKNIKPSVYVAGQGCNGSAQQTISKLRVRFWKEGEEENAQIVESQSGEYTINNVYNSALVIPYTNDILLSCLEETDIYMEVAGYSAIGWSDYSDRAVVAYTANNAFVTNNLTGLTFNNCEGGHQFTLTNMVKPDPDSWSAKIKGTETPATDQFTLNNGVMVWNNTGKDAGGYAYTFTFTKEGFPSASANLEFVYTASAPSAEIGDIQALPSTTTTPWTDVALSTSIPEGSGITGIEWSVSPSTVLIPGDGKHTSATFRGKPSIMSKKYTVTAKGISTDCVTTQPKTIDITVYPDEEDCTE